MPFRSIATWSAWISANRSTPDHNHGWKRRAQQSGNTFHVPKTVLISTLESRMHTQELKVAPRLVEAGPFREELSDFERHVTDACRTTWSARVGKHDDIVLATSLAVLRRLSDLSQRHRTTAAESSMPLADAFTSGMLKVFRPAA
jgi:hypothetical protein